MKYITLIAALLLTSCHPCYAQDYRQCNERWNDLEILLQIKEVRLLREIKESQERREFEARIDRYRYSTDVLK
jgi:hypothetical protein